MDPDLGSVQRDHWSEVYTRNPHLYGEEPSEAARHAAGVFAAQGAHEVLELGAGHGRDALWLARQGFRVHAADFSTTGLDQMARAAREQDLAARVHPVLHDVREPLPLADASVDAVFAHMLLCMALSTDRIRAVMREIRRVLRPDGNLVYTVRHTGDPHHGTGLAHGDDIYEHGGFAVHFFSRDLVDELAQDWELREVHPFTEGELPRHLWRITQARPAAR